MKLKLPLLASCNSWRLGIAHVGKHNDRDRRLLRLTLTGSPRSFCQKFFIVSISYRMGSVGYTYVIESTCCYFIGSWSIIRQNLQILIIDVLKWNNAQRGGHGLVRRFSSFHGGKGPLFRSTEALHPERSILHHRQHLERTDKEFLTNIPFGT